MVTQRYGKENGPQGQTRTIGPVECVAWRFLELSCDPHLLGTIALIFLSRALGGTVSFGLFYTVRYARLIWICLGIVVAGGAKTPHRCRKMEGRTEGGEGREEGGREGVSGI